MLGYFFLDAKKQIHGNQCLGISLDACWSGRLLTFNYSSVLSHARLAETKATMRGLASLKPWKACMSGSHQGLHTCAEPCQACQKKRAIRGLSSLKPWKACMLGSHHERLASCSQMLCPPPGCKLVLGTSPQMVWDQGHQSSPGSCICDRTQDVFGWQNADACMFCPIGIPQAWVLCQKTELISQSKSTL